MALGYKVALTNVWWNRGGQDVRLFQDTTEQQNYFAGLGLYWNELNNFNLNDNITTTIIFKDKSGRDAETLLKCNYAIVWNTIKNTYRYYFIAEIKQDSANQMQVALDLDDVNTNLVSNILKFSTDSILVKRWTGLNCYKEGATTKYKFNDYRISHIPQGDSPIKYNKGTSVVKIKQYTDDSINVWLRDNIVAWNYCFVVQNHTIRAYQITANDDIRIRAYARAVLIGNNVEELPYEAVAVPYYSGDKCIYVKYTYNSVDYYFKLTSQAMGTLFNISNNTPMGKYGFESKLSNISPLRNHNIYVDNDGDLIIEADVVEDATQNNKTLLSNGVNRFYRVEIASALWSNTSKDTAVESFCAGYRQQQTTYDAEGTQYLGTDTNGARNIKIFDKEYSSLRLRVVNQHYDYNPLALITSRTQTTIELKYTEVLKAGLTKIYLRAKNSGYYINAQEDYTGLVASLDLTEPILTNQWADYYANHKNYYMQTGFNNTIGLTKGLFNSGASGLATSFYTRNIYAGLGAGAIGGANTLLGALTNVVNQELDKDNMLQAPDGLSNANGDPYFYCAVSDIRPRLDSYQVQGTEASSILDNWDKYGVIYNTEMNLNSILFLHEKYEALSCIIEKESTPNMSTKEFNRLKELMATDRRYWHTDNFIGSNPCILTP